MTLSSLQHLLRAASALAEDCRFYVFGSASLLASFPELGEENAPLTSTYDADLCPQPFDELTGIMLEEALGANRAYYLRHGYHVDILRDSILPTLPEGWKDRLVPVPLCLNAMALEPHDLAAIKLSVGRPKDLSLVQFLITHRMLDASLVRDRLHALPLPVESLPKIIARWENMLP